MDTFSKATLIRVLKGGLEGSGKAPEWMSLLISTSICAPMSSDMDLMWSSRGIGLSHFIHTPLATLVPLEVPHPGTADLVLLHRPGTYSFLKSS